MRPNEASITAACAGLSVEKVELFPYAIFFPQYNTMLPAIYEFISIIGSQHVQFL